MLRWRRTRLWLGLVVTVARGEREGEFLHLCVDTPVLAGVWEQDVEKPPPGRLTGPPWVRGGRLRASAASTPDRGPPRRRGCPDCDVTRHVSAGLGLPRRRGWDRRGGMGAEGVFTRVPSARGVRASSACMPPARMIFLVIGERAVE